MDKPTIFISSTIYDFRDIRSALKDHLQSRGCDVNASEYHDFDKPLNTHSYDACLRAIERSDFFILLIGSRVGGWYDEPNKVSITCAEYRHAYELAKVGKIKILTFVRDEVWNHRQSIKELRKALKEEAGISAEQRVRLANHDTTFATDAETIIAFIDEVSRNRETGEAARGLGPMPTANWVHAIKGFKEIREAIDLLVLNGQSVDIAARKKALQSQLLSMLRQVVPSLGGKPFFPDSTIRRITAEFNMKATDVTRSIRVSGKTWGTFLMLAMLASKPRPEIGHFRQILTSDLLLNYDPATTTFNETPEYNLLADVIAQAANLGLSNDNGMHELFQHGQKVNSSEDRQVPSHVLAEHLHRMLRLGDLISSSKALVLALEGTPYLPPTRMPRTPYLDQEVGVAAEELSLGQIGEWVGL
jgi:hypothetical protein